jgi:hypothetical protein
MEKINELQMHSATKEKTYLACVSFEPLWYSPNELIGTRSFHSIRLSCIPNGIPRCWRVLTRWLNWKWKWEKKCLYEKIKDFNESLRNMLEVIRSEQKRERAASAARSNYDTNNVPLKFLELEKARECW